VRERFKQLVPSEIANAPGQEVVANVLAATLAAVAPQKSRTSAESSRREKS
jgi:ribosomal protein L11 methylase PrmA